MKAIILIFTLMMYSSFTEVQITVNSCPDNHQALSPEPLEMEWAIEWWMPRHHEKLQEPGREDAKLLFIGDSITQGWEDEGSDIWEEYFAGYGAFNLGYSGDRTENVLWRIENGELDGLDPTVTVLMIGTNNTGHRQDQPECVAKGISVILDEIGERLPDTQILLLAIFPRGETSGDSNRMINRDINDRIRQMDSRQVHFLDINDRFVDDEGDLLMDLMPDGLHPNENGYSVWAEAIHEKVSELMDRAEQ